jgi:hypothetical protein
VVLHWKRRLLLGLGLTVTLALVVVFPPPAAAESTLTGQTLSGSSSQGNSVACPAPTYRVSGTATGPYPGMFEESGTWSLSGGGNPPFSATFTITSGTTTITGSKTRGEPPWGFSCDPGLGFAAGANTSRSPYTATIHTPSGNFHDEGTSAVTVNITSSGAATLTESFTSSLAQPVLIVPTSKNQCKKGGWRDYPQFKNQGRCVRFVVTGKPPPGAERMSRPGQSKAPGKGNRSKAPK